jgi:hypothetical protein
MARFHLPTLFAELSWQVRWALIGGGSLVTAFASRLPETWQDFGLYCGIAMLAYGVIATGWHHLQKWHRDKTAAGKLGMASWQFIATCFLVALLAASAGAYGLGLRSIDRKQNEVGNTNRATITEPTQSSFGFAPIPRETTIQWKELFGTSRAVDLVIALFLDGKGPLSKSVKLKNAYIQSAVTGEIIEMKIGSTNPLDATFPISEANPIPPNGFIRLVATMNPTAPFQGVPNKEFYDTWKQTWFHAIYEDEKPDDILFDEKIMGSYFPELSGPHVTRKSNAPKE